MPANTTITTFDTNGESVFSKNVSSELKEVEFPYGTIGLVYATALPTDISNETDIESTTTYQNNGLPDQRTTVANGVAAAIIRFKPGADSAFHRTRTCDIGIVSEGMLEITLDSGEVRVLKRGDTLVQRGPMHKVKNITPDNAWAAMFFVALDARPIQIGEKTLKEEWLL